ncbi:LacI family DNA-binding transcriptional regulator [Salisediminibacterium halotolerans]|uniref:LacI family DNA-binding transcriptional regulator n=1 Tax=Salisediminibacterium halotolerans TaxID=517425 RepID=UPI000EAE4B24|nr:LacI family DNA-binding transcriptional regulator [Salisediminibacterium halotolerans]RLJ78278.1 LacI family transcriptional regulator [Actinophytocola xinjiangensis]RPE88383.1 LacI family transcriptional regulator [Salisediminibacterium halotolerans]TWG37255.1 LacI family transcriptional regulator [Salisediminibacterium halotolerans]GEL07734.1 LacI family transcriptional regulator [Salisediminibacterium halotolerans]
MDRNSIKDVAKLANVSTATVSHVINQTRFVAESTQEKVYQAMRELNYQPNSAARSLRSRKTNTIGLIVPFVATDITNYFFMSVANGIEDGLKKRGYKLILSNSNEDVKTEKQQIQDFNTQLIDGLIIAPVLSKADHYKRLFNDYYPVVFIDRMLDENIADVILVDNKGGTYEAVTAFIKNGHRRIGMIGGTLGITTSDDRYESFHQAVSDYAEENVEGMAKISSPSFEEGYRLTEQLIQEGITAIFVGNNVMAIGAMAALQNAGIKIPEDMAIIAYDNYEWMEITQPPLSTVSQPAFELGRKSVERLFERMEGDQSPFDITLLPTDLIIRSSH